MRKLIIFLIILILIPSIFADWFYNSQYITTSIDISSDADIETSTPSGYVDSATVNMTFFPKESDTQEVLEINTIPDADVTDKTIKFHWKRPEKIEFRLKAKVKTANTITWVKDKITFPTEEVPEELEIYTKPSETIDSGNDKIIKLASELVKGEDDYYSAVFKIADWTKNNIKYDLSTLTAEVSQKASWVLENRQGVCDELTSLFIALLRAVGIPARFVSGIAYTNSELFPEKWGPHGWTEVYFPWHGWIPFDVTYGQYGWIDPTHIKFKDSADSDEPSTYYQWAGRNADLETKKLDIKTEVIEKSGYYRVPVKISPSVLKDSINFGSYNLLEVFVENPNEFYYATELILNKPKEVDIIGNEQKSILLKPGEKKKLFWVLRLDQNLDRKYSYTLPLVLSTSTNITSETSFTASIREPEVQFEEAENAAKLLEEEKEKKYSSNVILECLPDKNEFYTYEDVKLSCKAKNTGNVFLEGIDVCFQNKCSKIGLGISQEKSIEFEIGKSSPGQKQEAVTLRNDLVSKSYFVNFRINDKPKIEIEELEFPANVSFEQNFTVSFIAARKSIAYPKNVDVIFSQNGVEKRWHVDELSGNRKFVVEIAASQMRYGINDYKINVDYYDELNQKHNTNKDFSIKLAGATPLQRLMLAANPIDRLSYETIIIMLLAGTIAFLAVVLVLFRRGKSKLG